MEHEKHGCKCNHDDSLHVDVHTIIGAHSHPNPKTLIGPHTIRCRRCDMEQDVFPPGFADTEQAREFLRDRLSLPTDTDDFEAAASKAYLDMPEFERQKFDAVWKGRGH